MQLNQKAEIKSEINVTPLVDVVLVLLIIFMVVTPMIVSREIQVPESKQPGTPQQTSQTIVYLNASGMLFFEDEPVVDELLAVRMRELYQRDSKITILLQADRRLKYDRVMEVLDLISGAGFLQIGLVARPSTSGTDSE